MSSDEWQVGKLVEVESRTWVGINKPGGCARITKLNYEKDHDGKDCITSVDVKYLVGGGSEKKVDVLVILPYEQLERGGRRRRGRDFFVPAKTGQKTEEAVVEEPGRRRRSTSAPKASKATKATKKTTKAKPSTTAKAKRTKAAAPPIIGQAKDANSPSVDQREVDDALSLTTPPAIKRSTSKPSSKKKRKADHPTPSPESFAGATESAKRKLIQEITPIPSVVTLGSPSEISPLDPLEKNFQVKAISKARRGLFTEDTTSKENPSDSVVSQPSTKVEAKKKQATPNAASKNTSKKSKPVKAAAIATKRTPGSTKAPTTTSSSTRKTKQPITVSSSPARLPTRPSIHASLSMTKKPPQSSSAAALSALASRKRSLKTLSRPQNLPENNQGGDKSVLRVPLKAVYEDELKKATDFMADITGHQDHDRIDGIAQSPPPSLSKACSPTPRYKENSKNQKQEDEDGSKSGGRMKMSSALKVQESLRYEQFLTIFQILRETKFEDEMMDESDFCTSTNKVTATMTFSNDEITKHLDKLSNEGKVVRSDGILYLV